MARRNYLVEGGSGTGKSSVCRELRKRGYRAVDGDNELAYKGDPETGTPTGRTGLGYETHVWDVDEVRRLAADQADEVIFFCGGSRNFHKFIDVFDGVFVLDVDAETLKQRLADRAADDWGGNDAQKEFILRLHDTKADVPQGMVVDTARPLSDVVDAIVESVTHARHAGVGRVSDLASVIPGLTLPAQPRGAIDVGCGTGEDARWLAEAGFQVVGVDVSANALEIAAERTPSDIDVHWHLGSADALPTDDASCVIVTDRGCLHHVAPEDVPAYVAEVERVLVSGGAWVIRDMLGHGHQHRDIDPERIRELAQGSTLEVETCELTDAPRENHGTHTFLLAVLRRR